MENVLIWLVAWIIVGLVFAGLFSSAFGDYYETLGMYFKDKTPQVCIMEPDTEVITNFYPDIYDITLESIDEWESALIEANGGNWNLDPIWLYEWEEHDTKEAWDFPKCNVFLNYELESERSALGITQLDFSKSRHQWTMATTFIEHYPKQTFYIQIGNSTNPNPTVHINMSEKQPLPLNDIKNIILHELGHALFGLGHYFLYDSSCVPDTECHDRSIMYHSLAPFTNQTKSITSEDIQMIERIFGKDGFGWNDRFKDNPRWIPNQCEFVNGTRSSCS